MTEQPFTASMLMFARNNLAAGRSLEDIAGRLQIGKADLDRALWKYLLVSTRQMERDLIERPAP